MRQYIEPMLHAAASPLIATSAAGTWGLCGLCRSWCNGGLCGDCLQRFAAQRPRCRRCGLATAQVVDRCGACIHDALAFEHTLVLADYEAPWPALITAFKFHQQIEWASAFAHALAEVVMRSKAPRPQLLAPVPLAPARLRERGFNQSWEIARRLGRRLRLPASARCLQRVRDTAHQIGMTREQRERNLRDAFWVEPQGRVPLAGLRVALVDDVLTTGATAQAAALALRRAGAAAVDLWVLARTAPADG